MQMTVIAFLFGAITIAAIVTNAFLNFLQRKHRIPLIVATFLVVALGAYAASFVVDMLLLAYENLDIQSYSRKTKL
jgi:uncharacterized membrane protein YwzB